MHFWILNSTSPVRRRTLTARRNLALRDRYQFPWWACSSVNAQPFQGKKKGADTGIDGVIYFQDDDELPKKIVVGVKGGENVSVAMVRDFAHVVDREKAAMGFFVTLTDPTRNMVTEGVGTSYYTSPLTGAKFPKLQVLTTDGLLSEKEQAHYPPWMPWPNLQEGEAGRRGVGAEKSFVTAEASNCTTSHSPDASRFGLF